MKEKRPTAKRPSVNHSAPLACSRCGNLERFVEIMDVEIHLVNGNRDYIKLLEGVADHYLCHDCGAEIEGAERTA